MAEPTTPTEITGTTPAGKAPRYVTVSRDDGHVTIAILSAQGGFLANARLTPTKARDLASALNNAATVASLRQQHGGAG